MKKGVYKICPICHKRFYVFQYLINKTIYCSRKCADTGRRKGIYKTCPVCKKRFYVYPSLINEKFYCSQKCCTIAKKEKLKPVYYYRHFRKGKYKICKFCGKPYYCHKFRLEKSSFCSLRCKGKWFIGKKANNWQGGKTSLNLRIRGRERYHNWRKKVYERDKYTCQDCGKKGVYFHAHHIKPFSKYPKLRFNISNGITLCKECHYKIHHF